MPREYFMETRRLRFSRWTPEDGELARLLWGDPEVTRYISADGIFTEEQIAARLALEVENQAMYGVQYWPVFLAESGELAGCCGLRPRTRSGSAEAPAVKESLVFELGFHLRPRFWRQGLAVEGARAAMAYAYFVLGADALFAGHNPRNERSREVLLGLGFRLTGEEFYPPTGLMHPSYELLREDWDPTRERP